MKNFIKTFAVLLVIILSCNMLLAQTKTLFWSDWYGGKIIKKNLVTNEVSDVVTGIQTDISIGGCITEIAVDETNQLIYWIEYGKYTGVAANDFGTTQRIMKANIDGTNQSVVKSNLGFHPKSIAIDPSHGLIFVTSYGAGANNGDIGLHVVKTDGSGLANISLGLDFTPVYVAIDTTNHYIFYTNEYSHVYRAVYNTSSGVLSSEMRFPSGSTWSDGPFSTGSCVTFDGANSKIFVNDLDYGIFKLTSSGTNQGNLGGTSNYNDGALSVDIAAQYVYYYNGNSNSIIKFDYSGENVSTVITGAGTTLGGNSYVYGVKIANVNSSTEPPTGSASQTFCSLISPKVSNLSATGNAIKWYAASSGGTALDTTTALVNNTHYYATQTVDGNESATRLDVTVTITTATSYYADNDGDGYGAGTAILACSQPANTSLNNTDCNDGVPSIHPGATEITGDGIDQNCDNRENCYTDNDHDSYGSNVILNSADCDCADVGESNRNGDCDDNNNAIYPFATEVCDGVDNDCDGSTDENVKNTYYADNDGDGYGAGAPILACSQPANTSLNNTDCNDGASSIHPGATEITGDGIDQNCDGRENCYTDNDHDSYGSDVILNSADCDCIDQGESNRNNDCNDNNNFIYPSAQEIFNSIDDDCDGDTDEGLENYRPDWGNIQSPSTVTVSKNEASPFIYGQVYKAGVTNRVNTTTTGVLAQLGYGTLNTDPTSDTSWKWVTGVYNQDYGNNDEFKARFSDSTVGVFAYAWRFSMNGGYSWLYCDNSGSTTTDPYSTSNQGVLTVNDIDADGDGYYSMNDCNDNNYAINPGATEICGNGIDDDCDGSTDECYTLTITRSGAGGGIVSSSPAGISCGATCSFQFLSGTNVTITATPDATSSFSGFTGDCSGTGTCNFTMDNNKTVNASFARIEYTLNIAKTGTGSGTVTSDIGGINCGSTCSATYIVYTSVNLTATPAFGSVFTGWSGSGCSGTGTCNVSMTSNKTATATFTCITPTTPVSISGNDSVCSGSTQTYSIDSVPYATSYIWSLPSGWSGSSTLKSITATAGNSGTISVIANNSCGSSTAKTFNITVNNLPTVNTASVLPSSVCATGQVTFSATASNGTIKWYDAAIGGTEKTVLNPTINTNTTYYAEAISIHGCVSTSRTAVSATVNALPTVSAGTYSNTCIDAADINLTGSPIGGVWLGTGVSGSLFDPSVGTQTLTYSFTDSNSCTNSSTTTITVYSVSDGGSISGTSSQIYGSSTGTLTLSGYTGSIQRWEHKLNNGSWTNITNTNNTYSETPTFCYNNDHSFPNFCWWKY